MSDELRDEIADLISKPRWSAGLSGGNERLADDLVAVVARERAATLEDLALMWERTAHLHGDAMNDADWEYLKLWCASVRVYSEHKYGAIRAAGTETGETS